MNTLPEDVQGRLSALIDKALDNWMDDAPNESDDELQEMALGALNDLEGIDGAFDNWHIKHDLRTFTYSGKEHTTTTLIIRYVDYSGTSTLEIEYDLLEINTISFERFNSAYIDDVEWMLTHSPLDFVTMVGAERLANIYKLIKNAQEMDDEANL